MPLDESVDKRIANAFFKHLNEINPDIEIDEYDLYTLPPPFLDYDVYRYLWYPLSDTRYEPSPEEIQSGEYLRQQCERLKQADIVVLTTPVWNYSVPAILKAWIDMVIAPNYLFQFGDNGIEPMHELKCLILFVSSGGTMSRNNARESLLNHLQAPFHFIGMQDCKVIWADGQNKSLYPDYREREEKAIMESRLLAEQIADYTKDQG